MYLTLFKKSLQNILIVSEGLSRLLYFFKIMDRSMLDYNRKSGSTRLPLRPSMGLLSSVHSRLHARNPNPGPSALYANV